jgi:hypothetical protein
VFVRELVNSEQISRTAQAVYTIDFGATTKELSSPGRPLRYRFTHSVCAPGTGPFRLRFLGEGSSKISNSCFDLEHGDYVVGPRDLIFSADLSIPMKAISFKNSQPGEKKGRFGHRSFVSHDESR